MPTSSVIYPIFAGTLVSGSSSLVLVDTGTTGDPGAVRRLVHPDSVNFATLVYATNPERTINFDTTPLLAPFVALQRTMTATRVTRFEMLEGDVVVTEVWPAGGNRASMSAAFFRLLYEYLNNPPDYDPLDPVYIHWEPRDRTDRIYAVELLKLSLGGGGEPDVYDVKEVRSRGGLYEGGSILAALDGLESVETGLLDAEVKLVMKIVAEVV